MGFLLFYAIIALGLAAGIILIVLVFSLLHLAQKGDAEQEKLFEAQQVWEDRAGIAPTAPGKRAVGFLLQAEPGQQETSPSEPKVMAR